MHFRCPCPGVSTAHYHSPVALPPGDQGPDLEGFSPGGEGFPAAEVDVIRSDVAQGLVESAKRLSATGKRRVFADTKITAYRVAA